MFDGSVDRLYITITMLNRYTRKSHKEHLLTILQKYFCVSP